MKTPHSHLWLFGGALTLSIVAALFLAAGCGDSDSNHNGHGSHNGAGDKQPSADTAGSGHVVNSICPIMGSKIDPAAVPANLTREWNGQKVGFCCGSCPGAWDKLSDADKRQKLQEAAAKAASTDHGSHDGHGHE